MFIWVKDSLEEMMLEYEDWHWSQVLDYNYIAFYRKNFFEQGHPVTFSQSKMLCSEKKTTKL